MMNPQKYRKGYFMPPACDMRWMMKDAVDHTPIWCSAWTCVTEIRRSSFR